MRNMKGRAAIKGEGIVDERSRSISYLRLAALKGRTSTTTLTFVDCFKRQGPQVRMPNGHTGATPFSPGPGCH